MSSGATSGRVYRLGFATGGVTTNASAAGSAVVVSDANRVRVAGLTESVMASGLSGVSTVLPSSETKVFGIGVTGDGVAGVNSVTITLSDSSTSTGLVSTDVDSLKLYVSADATLSSDDTLIGSQATVNIGSATTISATSTHIPSASSTVYYLIGVKLSSSAVRGHVLRLGFASGGVTTNASSVGTTVTASDANRLRVAGLTERVVSTGLSGVSTILPGTETKVFGVGFTGDGVAGVKSVTVTVSDSSTSSGLVSSDFDSLKLYVSSDATLSSDDTLIGSQTTVTVGSATTISATSTHIPSASSTVYYLIGAKLSSSAVSGHVFRIGFTTGGVTTNASAVGTAVTASDANRVRVAGLGSGAVATGLSGATTVFPGAEVQIFRYGLVGDGVAGLNGVTLTLSDLSTSTGMSSTDVDSLKLYHSTDVTLDSGDTLIGSQTTVNVGSATTISTTSTDIPTSGTTRYYLVSAKLSASAVGDHAFKVGFASGGVSTNAGTSGTAVTANDANKVTVKGITETTVASGLSGEVKVVPKQESQIFQVGLTGNGIAGLNGVTLTLSDLSTATGLVSGDVDSLKLYRSANALLDSSDTLIGVQTAVNVGSATTVSVTTADVLSGTTEQFYLVSVVMGAAAIGNHAFKVGFAAAGVGTALGGRGSAIAALDSNVVRVLSPPTLVRFGGISMNTATPTLDWADVVGAVSYVLEVSDRSNFVSVNRVSGLTKSQYTLPSALEDGSYFWRVSAVTSVGATQLSLPDVFVVASKRSDPQGVAVRIAAPQKGQIVGIGDTVLVQVLAYRALSVLDTVIVGLSTSTATELFGNVGIIDTLTTVTSVGASVDTFSFPLVVKARAIETQGLGVVAQARVSVKKDGLPLKGIDNQSGLPVIGDLPDFGFVGDSVKVGVDGQRPLNSGFFQMAMIDTTTLPNTGGRVFGVRTTSDGAANNQQLIRSFKTGDDVTLRLKAGNIGTGGAVSARLYVVDAVTPGYQVPDSSLYSAKIDLGDLLRANGDLRVTFKAAEGQFQHASVKQNMRVKVLGYVVDGAGNLSANTTGAVTPQGYEQDIWVVADTQTPVVHMTHPAKEGERFTGRVDTSVVYRKDDGALDTTFKFDLKPLQFGVNEATMARWVIVGTDTAHYGGVSDTTGLKVTTRDSFALTTRPVAGQKIDLSVVVKDSVGNKGVAKVSNVVLDEVAPTINGLFPSSRRLPKGNPTFNPTMLSPTFLANEGLDSISVRYVQIGGSQIATSNVATVTKDGITVSVSDSLMDASQYTLQVFARDLAGNVQVSALDTLVYESTIENPKADSFAVVIDSTITVVDSVIAGVNLPLQVTAWDTKVPTAALVALTYNKVGVLVRAVAPGQDVSGVSFGGVGVVDHGNGTATLNGEGWVAGSRIVLVKSVRTLDDFSVVVADTNWVTDSVFVNFEGRLSGLTVDAGAFDHYAIMAKENGQVTQVVSGAFDLWVQPTDAYGNPSNKVFVGAVDLRSVDSLQASTNLLDTRIPLGNVKGSTWVMFSANVGDVSLPQGAQEILQTGRLLSGVAPSREGDGLVIRVRVANEKGDSVGVSVGQSVPLAYVMSEEAVDGAIELADPVAPANVIVQDFLGPDGTGDQGRYVMVSFGHTQAQERVGHYRVYREVLIQSALNESGEVVILETPELQFVPWAVIEVPVGGPVPQVIQAVVPALDNVATRWAIAGEWGGESIEGGPLGKRVFPKAQVEQVMQVLGVTTELIEQAIDLDLGEETDLVLANLDIDVGAWQKDVPVNVRTKSGHLETTDRVVSEAVRAVDNLAPQGVLDVFATVSDDETEVRLAWQPSVDDRTVGAVYYRGYSVPIPGVERYEVLRGDKVETLIPVAMLPAKSRAFRAPFVTGSVYRIDVLDLDNRTMGEPFRVDRAGPTLAVGVDTVRAGESTTVAISIGRSKGMTGGTIKLLYDASVMTAEAVVGGDITSGMLVLGRLDVPGEITLSLAGASGVQVDEGVLAQVQFSTRSQAVGDYALKLASVELRDEVGDVMVLSGRRNGLLSILSNQVQVLVGDVSVDAGKTVVVPVQVENAMGLAGGAWSMMYDANVMTAVRVDAGAEALASGMLVFGRTDVAGQVQITVAGAQGLVLGMGELAQVVFEVHSDVPDGLYDVVMQDVSLRNALGGVMAVAQGQTGWVTVPEGGAGVRVQVGEVIALLGERDVRIDVRVDRAVGVAGGELVLRYDASALTATGVEPGALALSSGMLVLGRTDVPGEVRVTLAGALAVAEVSGVLLGVRFDVKASAVAGEYPFEVVRADFRSASGAVMGTGLITQGRVRIPARDAGVGMYVTNVTSSAGGVVDVGVGVDRAVALAGGEVKLVYDPKNLTARLVRAGASATGLLVLGRTDVVGDVRIVFAGGSGLGQATGELAVVTFEVANSTLDGVYDVRLVSTALRDASGNPLLVSERVPGTVTVIPTADFNGDGNLTASDVTLFAQHLGKQTAETDFDRRFDMNRDGYVSFQDFIAFVEAFAEKQSKTTEVNDETRTKIYQNETEQSQ
ncbi:MAG: cohesin domain-containing protein [Candidatus Latescibacterota bacterium]